MEEQAAPGVSLRIKATRSVMRVRASRSCAKNAASPTAPRVSRGCAEFLKRRGRAESILLRAICFVVLDDFSWKTHAFPETRRAFPQAETRF